MKTLNKIKLNNLSAENLSEKQMKEIRGGGGLVTCTCSCYWEDQNGSSADNNCKANTINNGTEGGHSSEGDNQKTCYSYWS